MNPLESAFGRTVFLSLFVAASVFSSAQLAAVQTTNVLYTFTGGADGAEPSAVILDASGNLYGATRDSVFELSPSSGDGWTFTTLYNFSTFATGLQPTGALIFDSAGNLYGTASQGGDSNCDPPQGCGVVFELSPHKDGWAETVLHTFRGNGDGTSPGSLIFDAAGNLYGVTANGGNAFCTALGIGCGTVFELSKVAGAWQKTVLYRFTGRQDGGGPVGGLIFDPAGNLYGSTTFGGSYSGRCALYGCGVVYQLAPAFGVWQEHVVHTFTGNNDGLNPEAGPIIDAAGNLYAPVGYGGEHSSGTILKLIPAFAGRWTASVLYAFNFHDGFNPDGIAFDASGNIYGSTVWGGSTQNGICFELGCGVAFKLTPQAEGSWTETVLHIFTGGNDGSLPSPLALDQAGNAFGATVVGGADGWGTIFEITP